MRQNVAEQLMMEDAQKFCASRSDRILLLCIVQRILLIEGWWVGSLPGVRHEKDGVNWRLSAGMGM
jgi:hypothetical protein